PQNIGQVPAPATNRKASDKYRLPPPSAKHQARIPAPATKRKTSGTDTGSSHQPQNHHTHIPDPATNRKTITHIYRLQPPTAKPSHTHTGSSHYL
ncbi:hypothetical protein, partial [Thiolapillus sp.]|uniref:hypothetical protein n=1 Tax=Thiolapillus sp. TaxID=2017437 RepID=UPI0025F25B8E